MQAINRIAFMKHEVEEEIEKLQEGAHQQTKGHICKVYFLLVSENACHTIVYFINTSLIL